MKKGRLGAGAFTEERRRLEGRRGAVSWLAARLRPVYSLPAAHMWVWGICGMWVTALSSSLRRTIISVYIMFTKRTWPQVHYAKYKGHECRGEAKKIWCEERGTGSRVSEISVQSCSWPLFFYVVKSVRGMSLSGLGWEKIRDQL